MKKLLTFFLVFLIFTNAYASRNKEPLENFKIEQLSLKGVIRDRNQSIALIIDPNDVIYNVKVGNYIGKNNGFVYEINSDFIKVVEVVRLKNKKWVEREVVIKIEVGRK